MKKVIQVTFSLLVLVFLISGLWFLLQYIFQELAGLGKEVIAAAITALVGLFGILYAQWSSKAKEISNSHRPAKVEVYELFFDIIDHFIANGKGKDIDMENEDLPEELRDQFKKLNRGMIIWSSPQVIKAWINFKEQSGKGGGAKDILLAIDEVFQAIRLDLDNKNSGFTKGNVVKMYLKDPKEMDKIIATN